MMGIWKGHKRFPYIKGMNNGVFVECIQKATSCLLHMKIQNQIQCVSLGSYPAIRADAASNYHRFHRIDFFLHSNPLRQG